MEPRHVCIVACALCVPAAARAQEDVSEDELAEIEAATAADAAALEESQPAPPPAAPRSYNPDLSIVVDVAAAYFGRDEDLQTGAHDPHEDGFTLQQVELAFGSSVDPYFRVDGNLVFGVEGVEVEEAYATTLALPASLQARVGQMLTRFGRINAQHPHSWDLVDQPIAIGAVFGPEGNRGVGAELSWLSPLPWYVELVASVTGGGEPHAHDEEPVPPEDEDEPQHLQPTVAVKQFFELSHDWSLAIGVSGAMLEDADVAGADLYLKYRPITGRQRGIYTQVSVQAEWLVRRHDGHSEHGGYGQLAWRFARRWGVAGRYEYTDFELRRQRAAAAVAFWPTEFSRVRLQGGADRLADDPLPFAFLQFEFLIGAHGAHTF